MRRSIGLILCGLMLVLNYERADVACAKHHVGRSPYHAMPHASHQHSQRAPEKDCSTPAQADCCAAIATCSIVLSVDEIGLATSMHVREAAVAPIQSAPHSRVTTPDPPPPRV